MQILYLGAAAVSRLGGELNKWYSIVMEQKKVAEKVRILKNIKLKSIVYQYFYIITIDGQEVYNVENSEPRVFQDVKVFAGDEQGAADARYKNLVWETDVCKT